MVAKPPGVHCETVSSLSKKSPMINWSQSLMDLEFTILIISNKVDIHSPEGNIYTLNKERVPHVPFKMFPPG